MNGQNLQPQLILKKKRKIDSVKIIFLFIELSVVLNSLKVFIKKS